MRISDWSSDVCSSDLRHAGGARHRWSRLRCRRRGDGALLHPAGRRRAAQRCWRRKRPRGAPAFRLLDPLSLRALHPADPRPCARTAGPWVLGGQRALWRRACGLMAMAGQHDDERRKRQKLKNWVLLAALLTFVVVVYFVAIIRMSGG